MTNQKGGVGKTTTVANLGAALAQRGVRVCLIDLDPQAHLTMHFGIDPSGLSRSMYDVLTTDMPLSRAAIEIEPNLTLIPSVIDLAAAEVELAGAVGREQILADKIAAEVPPFDLMMFDCPPSLSLLTLNALSAVKEVLIPLQPHFLALQGLGKLLETVSLVQRRINTELRVSGVVFCLYETATRLAAEIIDDVEAFFAEARTGGQPAWASTRIFRARIRRNIKLAECPSYGTTIYKYDPSSHGAQDYSRLAGEFIAVWPDAPEVARATLTEEDTLGVATPEWVEEQPDEPEPTEPDAPVAEEPAPVEPAPAAEPPVEAAAPVVGIPVIEPDPPAPTEGITVVDAPAPLPAELTPTKPPVPRETPVAETGPPADRPDTPVDPNTPAT